MQTARAERLVYLQTPPQQDGKKPLWHEILAPAEFPWLLMSEVWRGKGIPHGDGSSVFLLPGFMVGDPTLYMMEDWLRRIDYEPKYVGIGSNTDPERYTFKLIERSREEYKRTGRRSHYIGHSLGGTIARAAAVLDPEPVISVNTLASPISDDIEKYVDPFVYELARRLIPLLDESKESIQRKEALLSHLPEHIIGNSIHTKSDGVVNWRGTIDTRPNSRNVEVRGSHVGLVFNPEAYKKIAQFLHEAKEAQPIKTENIIIFPTSKIFSRPSA
ncbi:MAG: alpha/beta hydrolase [Patescibacteria group bacterium]